MQSGLQAARALGRRFATGIADLFETADFSTRRRNVYAATLIATFLLVLGAHVVDLPALMSGVRTLNDFDEFHIVGRLVSAGEVVKAYHWPNLAQIQLTMVPEPVFMPWTYPPQFDLVVGALAQIARPAAYGLFTALTLAAYLAVLRRVAGSGFVSALMLLSPTIYVTVVCGQNGFLTGALFGLAILGFARRSAVAGGALGLLVIKPHLAVAFGLFTLVQRRWAMALAAVAVIAVTSVLATFVLGGAVWTAFLAGAREAGVFLEQGRYPLFRMVSPYATLRGLGLPGAVALLGQAIVAAMTLALVCWPRPSAPLRQGLGLMALGSLLISPYAYDYDLPIFGVGLALLLPDLRRLGSAAERAWFYGLTLFTGGSGLAISMATQVGAPRALADQAPLPSLAGFSLSALMILAWRIVRRDRGEGAQP